MKKWVTRCCFSLRNWYNVGEGYEIVSKADKEKRDEGTLTGRGPSSKLRLRVPGGPSQISPGILHWADEEHTLGLMGS